MRKIIITLTVLALVVSIVGTGLLVYVESSAPTPVPVDQETGK